MSSYAPPGIYKPKRRKKDKMLRLGTMSLKEIKLEMDS